MVPREQRKGESKTPQPPFQGGALDQTHLPLLQPAILSIQSEVVPSIYSDSRLKLITFLREAVLSDVS